MNVFYRMKKGTEYLNYGREIITDYCMKCAKDCEGRGNIRILDLGAGAGTDLQNCRKKLAGGEKRYCALGFGKLCTQRGTTEKAGNPSKMF